MKYYLVDVIQEGDVVETLRVDEGQKRVIEHLAYAIDDAFFSLSIIEEEDKKLVDLTKP